MSMGLNDEDVVEAAMLLSSERLARYQAMSGSLRSALELHRLAMQLSGSMLAVIGVIEIALRNATNEPSNGLFGRSNWLQDPPSPVVWRRYEQDRIKDAVRSARRSAYASLGYDRKKALDAATTPQGPSLRGQTVHQDRARRRQKAIIVSEGQVIAQLTFGFWKGLFAAEYEATLWRRSLRRIFPNKSITRPMIASHLEVIYQTRNRIAP